MEKFAEAGSNQIKIGILLAPFGPARGIMALTYGQAVEQLKETGLALEVRIDNMAGADQTAVDPDPAFIEWLDDDADMVLAHVPAAYDAVFTQMQALHQKTGKPVIPLSPECASIAGGIDRQTVKTLWAYHGNGGMTNVRNLLRFAIHVSGLGPDDTPPPPEEMPLCGIYHPESLESFDSLDAYRNWRPPKAGAPTVGLFFPRSYWIDDALAVFDALIEKLEKGGANVIAVFNDKFKSGGDDVVMEKFFIADGTACVDAVIVQAYFFLKSSREKNGAGIHQEASKILERLNVPALLMINSLQTQAEYEQSAEGLTIPQSIITVALPEFDGIGQPVLVGVSEAHIDLTTGAKVMRPIPLDAQISYLVRRVRKWCALREKPNPQKKIAIILHNSPCRSGVEATVGAGFGLDTLESVALLLQRMQREGYELDWVPQSGRELIETILEKKAISEFRWTPLSEIIQKGGAAGFVPLSRYGQWLEELPESSRSTLFQGWGNPFETDIEELEDLQRSSLALHDGCITIPGLMLGNVFIGLQPKRGCAGARCDGSVCKILHDPEVPPPHQYLAFYKWIEKDFGADAMLHVGTHGNIELLPGKSVGLSPACFSHFAVGSLPHLYIYVVSNPMEGSIAKRRGLAVIVDHLHPVMAAVKLYGPLEDLEDPLEEYARARAAHERGRLKELETIISEKAQQAAIVKTAGQFDDFHAFVDYLHGQMTMLRETMFRDGLHTLGRPPVDDQLISMLASILRFDQGQVPSLRRWIIESLGLDWDKVLETPERVDPHLGRTHARLLERADDAARQILSDTLQHYPGQTETIVASAVQTVQALYGIDVSTMPADQTQALMDIVEFGMGLVPAIAQTTDEIDNLIRGLNGEFIPPGASGALARGKVETLPTGRNFFSIDPFKIPTPAAWNVGIRLTETFFHKYLHEHDDYPESIGFVFRFFDIFRADGEQLAQMLYTLGVKPVWDGSRITRLEVIPLETLQRPRVDITVQLSNMLRDGCPRAFELVDEAVQLVADLDEPPEKNFVRKHVLERLQEMAPQDDLKAQKRMATFRVFTAAPGVYDYGANTAVAASAWETEDDLADIFIDTCHYAYGKGSFGVAAKPAFTASLKHVSVTYDKWDSDEYDILECCHIFGSHGGFTQAVKTVSGKEVDVYFGDTHDPDRPRIRDMADELDRVARTRLLNPAWVESKKRHGYKGATVMADRIYHIYGWQATTRLVGNWVFDDIARTFALDEEMRRWFEANNPYALESITRRLIEAEQRSLWKADPELLEQLREVFLEVEGWMEDRMEDVTGDFQGSDIDIVKIDPYKVAR
ncbi:cobaltochelatase subunit CobN [Desulfosarcina ovata subsp. sediminis]|uniref:Cobaltochelatase subunit CobN n=1 Tax=Desulfosarcina ovata subsp. sediminis TaxID=885957 RepID=A0A5K7ZKM5_9BACT|nr:cobaltochelatase subunit CobN [Desulfosarcina ovata]BBO81924.1 cobaltochelatase subunit CobN [Desulfosarcina ovata subsp. sediminis]